MAANTRFATAMHALVLLARNPEKPQSSESLAEKLQTNSVVIRRILAQLQSGGIVRNRKGPAGGSELVKPATKITLGDVYRITDPGSLFPHWVVRGAAAKRLSDELTRAQLLAEKAMLQSLSETTLDQLARRSAKK